MQYVAWLGDVARGDLGESFQNRRPVRDILLDALANSLRLAAYALAIEVVLGLVAGRSRASPVARSSTCS